MSSFTILRSILGLALASAAVLKGHQLATEPVIETGLFNSRWFLIVMVELEGAMALWMLAGAVPQQLRYAAIVLWTLLLGAAASKTIAGESSCGCFGRWAVPPGFVAFFDLAAVVALYLMRPRPLCGGRGPLLGLGGASKTRLAAIAAALVACGVPAAVAMASYEPARLADNGDIVGVGERVWLEPHRWLGKPLPLVRHLEMPTDVSVGAWTVVLVQPDCSRCQESIASYQQSLGEWCDHIGDRSGFAKRLAFVSIQSASGVENTLAIFAESGAVVTGRLSSRVRWYAAVPVELELQDGVVMRVRTPA